MPSPVRSALVATQPYPSSPVSHASTACVDLYAFASECYRSGCARERFGADRKSQISVLSSIQLSPKWVREDYIYDTVDVFPVFQVSPDTAKYLPATSPIMPPDTGSLLTSPISPGSDSLPPHRMSLPYRTGNRFGVIIASVDSISG